MTVLNETGSFKLILNKFLVNFTNKSVILNYKFCHYKITQVEEKNLAFESIKTFDTLFDIFSKKVNFDKPYFEPIFKKNKLSSGQSEIPEKNISKTLQFISPATRSVNKPIKKPTRIKVIPVRPFQNINISEIPEIVSEDCEDSLINTSTQSSLHIEDIKSSIYTKKYFINSEGKIKVDLNLSLLNDQNNKPTDLELKFQERMARISRKNKKHLFPIIPKEFSHF